MSLNFPQKYDFNGCTVSPLNKYTMIYWAETLLLDIYNVAKFTVGIFNEHMRLNNF